MNLRPFLAAAVVCWAAIPFAGFAQDWPRFRGENNAGVVESANIPAQWSPEDILWRIELPGIGHGSMAVAGERIFLLCAEEKSSKRIPVCINAKNGEVLWSKEYDTEKFKGHRFNSPASTTPALDEERVYYTWEPRSDSRPWP